MPDRGLPESRNRTSGRVIFHGADWRFAIARRSCSDLPFTALKLTELRKQDRYEAFMIRGYSDHAANERTFLAWVRTAIAVMAFGFLVEKFDLFLEVAAPSLSGRTLSLPGQRFGNIAGLALIVLGTAMVAIAAVRFLITAKNIDSEEPHPVRDRGSTWRLLFYWPFWAALYFFISPTRSWPRSEAARGPCAALGEKCPGQRRFNHESMRELSMVGVGCRLGGLVCRLDILVVYPAMDMGVSMTTT